METYLARLPDAWLVLELIKVHARPSVRRRAERCFLETGCYDTNLHRNDLPSKTFCNPVICKTAHPQPRHSCTRSAGTSPLHLEFRRRALRPDSHPKLVTACIDVQHLRPCDNNNSLESGIDVVGAQHRHSTDHRIKPSAGRRVPAYRPGTKSTWSALEQHTITSPALWYDPDPTRADKKVTEGSLCDCAPPKRPLYKPSPLHMSARDQPT